MARFRLYRAYLRDFMGRFRVFNVFLGVAVLGAAVFTVAPGLQRPLAQLAPPTSPGAVQQAEVVPSAGGSVSQSRPAAQVALSGVVGSSPPQASQFGPQVSSYLRSAGNKLINGSNSEVRLTGVNWFGLETDTFAPHGLWARNWGEMMDQMVQAGFNSIRLPYSNQLFDPSSRPKGIDFIKNADLEGLSGLQIMDKIIEGAGQRGMKIILDRHRPTADAQSELWYTDRMSEQRWTSDWVMLAKRYKGNPTVIGADLHNEPRGKATWGDDNLSTDWRLAAERAGNAILGANPDWLIIVEGVEQHQQHYYWWGGNLMWAKEFPVRLSHPDKLVYSAHEYGPGVFQQDWFRAPDFPNNLPKLWNDRWAYVQKEGIAPLLMGEFGGRSVGQDTEGVWQRTLMQFLKESNISYTYWSWNPNSGDTGGVLKDDWITLDRAKVDMLAGYEWPMLDKAQPKG